MPKDSLNIYMTIQDGMSPALASITDKTKALDKETQQLQQTTNAMTKASQSLLEKQVKLQSEYDSSKKKLKDCQKAYDEYQDELSRANLDNAIKEHAKLKNELIEVTEQLNTNKRAYKDNVEAIRKGGLGLGSGVGLGQGGESGLNGTRMAIGLISGQAGQMLSSSVGGLAEFLAKSELGVPTAELLSDGISNAISGMMAGSVFGPVGMAVGAALGGFSGLISGQTKIWEAQDDAFKDYYGGLYEDVSARSDETVESGSTIAAGREKDKISFTTLFKSEDKAERYLDELVDMANTTPFLYDDLTAMSKTLATYGYNDRTILPQLQVIGDTGAALGMNTSDMTAVAQALGRMKSSGKTTLEYLNILNDRGIGAVGMLADAKGVSVGDMYKMISDGKIAGGDAVNIITAALKEAYSGSMLTQSRTFEGLTSTREGLEQELENAAGEGYNTLRKEGLQAEVDALGGDLGDGMKEFNTIIGENQARKENLQGEYERQVMDVVLNGRTGDLWGDIDEDSQSKLENMHNDLVEWKTKLEESKANGDEEGAALASANIEALFETAQAMGKSLFDNSEFMRALGEVERDEIAMIRENTAGLVDIVQNIYLKTQELSKGLGSSYLTHLPDGTGLTYLPDGNVLTYLPDGNVLTNQPDSASQGALPDGDKSQSAAKAHAYGLRRVPFDGYPALLHEGERVLTKSEAEHALAEDGPRLGADAEGSLLDALTSARGDIYDAGRWGRRPLHDTGEYPRLRWAVGGPRSAGSGGESQDAAPGGGGAQRPGDAAAGGLHITITGNDFVGTGEEMADQIMEVLIRKLEQAYTAAGR